MSINTALKQQYYYSPPYLIHENEDCKIVVKVYFCSLLIKNLHLQKQNPCVI